MTKEIKLGNPIILIDANGMKEHTLFKGQKGIANSLIYVDGGDYILFMPNGVDKMYWMGAYRFVLDEEALGEKDEATN